MANATTLTDKETAVVDIGAADCWFQHIAIEVPGAETRTEWCEPVTE